jgi:hypothetical protein
MQKLLILLSFTASVFGVHAQSPIGNWKVVSHTVEFDGQKMDTHAALLEQKPCAAKVVYQINEDATFRLKATDSGCDERYIQIQEKLYSKTKWKMESGVLMTSATNFEVGQSYKVSFSGDTMTWVGTDGQGTIVYKKIK